MMLGPSSLYLEESGWTTRGVRRRGKPKRLAAKPFSWQIGTHARFLFYLKDLFNSIYHCIFMCVIFITVMGDRVARLAPDSRQAGR
jgi:hypothetical protein